MQTPRNQNQQIFPPRSRMELNWLLSNKKNKNRRDTQKQLHKQSQLVCAIHLTPCLTHRQTDVLFYSYALSIVPLFNSSNALYKFAVFATCLTFGHSRHLLSASRNTMWLALGDFVFVTIISIIVCFKSICLCLTYVCTNVLLETR